MDFLQKIGGRKFLMALLVVGAALGLEITGHPLSPTMAGFLTAIVGLFSAANYATTVKHMDSKPQSGGKVADIQSQLDTISQKIDSANDPEVVEKLAGLLKDIQSKLSQVEIVSSQMGSAVVNLSQLLTRK